MMYFSTPETEEEVEEPSEDNSSLDDDLLDEVTETDSSDNEEDDSTEGFGHITEDDAEDVDYDSFDDVDEL